MKKLLIFKISFLFLCITHVYGDEFLQIRNVDNPWYFQEGSIDKVLLTVEPKGLYAECGLYLDFSTKGTSFYYSDSLEIQMGFELPENAEIIDMWLWVFGIPVKAGIYDRWTATQIYNDIVNIRTDPALLIKEENNYCINIFPLMTNMPRKVKITYLVPIENISLTQSSVPLPLNILNLSKEKIDLIQVVYIPDSVYQDPYIAEDPYNMFYQGNHPVFGRHYMSVLSNITAFSTFTLSLSNQSSKKNYIGVYNEQNSKEGYYQIEIQPSEIFDIDIPRKVMIILDFIPSNCISLSNDDVLNHLKQAIYDNLSKDDSFNVMFSGSNTLTLMNKWIPGDSLSISNAFDTINPNIFTPASYIHSLLYNAINFIQNNGSYGKIILISSSNVHGSYKKTSNIMNNVKFLMGDHILPINVIDLYDRPYYMNLLNYIGGRTYYGNEYLYRSLCDFTDGELSNISSHTYQNMLSNSITSSFGYYFLCDIHISPDSGFTYSNYEISSSKGLFSLNNKFKQTGRFYGKFPFEVDLSALLPTGEYYDTTILFNKSEVLQFDSVTKTIWNYQLLNDMLSQNQSNSMINQILETSIRERILTEYTAFLALEPENDTLYINTGTVGTIPFNDNIQSVDSFYYELSNYPNPFTSKTTIKYEISENARITIEVYDLFGVKINVLVNKYHYAGEYYVTFDGTDLSSGIYYYQLVVDGRCSARNKMVITK